MKKLSLKSLVALFAITTACNLPGNKNETTEQYNRAMALLHRAEFLRHEGDIDSAVSYYKKSAALCYVLAKQTDSAKDTLYKMRVAELYSHISWVYDSLHNFDSALIYLTESLKWAKTSNLLYLQISDEYLIGCIYYKTGKELKQDIEHRKELYNKGVNYAKKVITNLDSLSLPQKKSDQYKLRIGSYALCDVMYRELGDSARAQFYRNKYKELKAQSLNITGGN